MMQPCVNKSYSYVLQKEDKKSIRSHQRLTLARFTVSAQLTQIKGTYRGMKDKNQNY